MATDYLNDIVQNIITKCDLTDLNLLMHNVDDLAKKARKLGKAFNAALTGEQQVALAKSNEIISHNIARQKEANAVLAEHNKEVSWNNVQLAEQNRLKAKNNNATKLAYSETAKILSQNKLLTQQSKERVAQMRKENSEIRRQTSLMRSLGRFIMAYFGFHTIRNIVETGSKLQLLRQSIVGLTKDVQDWDYIQKTAHATGNSLEIVARGYKNFYAAANMAGFNKNSIQSMYSDMVMATRAIGASSQQTEGALLALEQMISKGTVSMEELRRQLGNAVPGAFEIGAKAMNMTTQEFNKFVKTGQLASAVFVPKFIAEFKKQYADGFKEIAGTFDFAMGQLRESWQELQLEIMHGEIGKELANIVRSIDRLISSKGFKDFIKITSRIISFVLDHLPLILFLLGANGLFRLIGNNANAMALLNMQWKEGIILASLFAKDGIVAFLANAKAAAIFHAKLLSIILALATVDDMFTGILHFFGLTDRDSYTGRMLDAMSGKGNTGIGTDAPGGNIPWKNRESITKAKEYYENQKKEGWRLRKEGLKNFMFGGIWKQFGVPEWNVGSDLINKANQQLEYIKKEEQNLNLNYTVYVVDQTGGANANMQNVVVKTLEKFFIEHNKRFNF